MLRAYKIAIVPLDTNKYILNFFRPNRTGFILYSVHRSKAPLNNDISTLGVVKPISDGAVELETVFCREAWENTASKPKVLVTKEPKIIEALKYIRVSIRVLVDVHILVIILVIVVEFRVEIVSETVSEGTKITPLVDAANVSSNGSYGSALKLPTFVARTIGAHGLTAFFLTHWLSALLRLFLGLGLGTSIVML
ncbi:hypothetical protein BGX38DRAFT_601718 [Terfezia claveryi]|nr:hypothetical protein BGX38DRAFT_601718 [Terfezia claveryi]